MSAVVRNKYKSMLMEKKKLVDVPSAGTQQKFERKEIKFLPFFSPNKLVQMKDEVVVRVLPNKESFYHEYKKHMVKLGSGSWKQFMCFHSINENGAEYGKCPLCDFLDDNSQGLDKNTAFQLSAKNTYLLFVYSADANQIQKYETNDFGIVDITSALIKLIDENDNFDPDSEGFGLIFRKASNGYAKAVEAILPSVSVEEIVAQADNINEIKDFYEEIMPFTKDYTIKQINTAFAQIIKSFAPTFDYGDYITGEVLEDKIDKVDKVAEVKEVEKQKPKVTKTIVEPDEDEDEDYEDEEVEEETIEDNVSQVANIRDFLKNRKKEV